MSKEFESLTGAQAGCSRCGEVFANVTLFDRHREEWKINSNQELTGNCLDPTKEWGIALGLVSINGVWYDEAGVRMLAKAAAARSTKASMRLSE